MRSATAAMKSMSWLITMQVRAAGVIPDDLRQPRSLVCVQILGRLVEQQHLRLAQQAARQRDQPLLASRRHLHVDDGVVAAVNPRRVDDDRVDLGQLAGLFDRRIARILSRHSDVLADRVLGEERELCELGDLLTQTSIS